VVRPGEDDEIPIKIADPDLALAGLGISPGRRGPEKPEYPATH
jgi:hypothetical protein